MDRSRETVLRQPITDPLLGRLSSRATVLLTLLALIVWAIAGWASVISKYALMLFVVVVFVVLEYNIIQHPLPDAKDQGQERLSTTPLQFPLMVFVTLLAVALVAILDVDPDLLRRFLNWVASLLRISEVAKFIALALNLWFIALFLGDAIARWVRYARRWSLSKRDPMSGARPPVTFAERIARDLVAGSALLALLGLAFQVDVYRSAVSLFTQLARLPASPITNCTVSWYFGDCSSLAQFGTALTITFVNECAAVAIFVIGTGLLAFTENIGLFTGQKSLVDVVRNIIVGIGGIWKTLLRVLENLVILVRGAIWPLLVFLAVFCLGLEVLLTRWYLALLNCEHTLLLNGKATYYGTPDQRCQDWGAQAGWIDNNVNNFLFVGGILALVVAAALLILLAVMVQYYGRQNPVRQVRAIFTYWLRELLQIGLAVLFSVGLISVVLAAADGLVTIFQKYGPVALDIPHPYLPPGVITYLALVEFICIAILWVVGRRQRER
jgi:hypothetical protein